MLTFHIKADMSVQSLTSGLNIGDGFEDIVVISDMEYALITMKMISPSGEAIPDVQFTPILEDGKTIWKAILPYGAISSGGLLTYQFFITTASGKMYKTERGGIRVLDSVNNYMPDSVNGFTNYTITQYYELLAAIQTLANSNQEQLKSIITSKYIVVTKNDWESKYERIIVDSDETITDGLVMLVVPANEQTKELASSLRLRIKLTQDAESKLHSLVLTRSEKEPLPDISLFFNVLYIRRNTGIYPAAVLVGADTVPADIDATVRELRNVLSTKMVTLSKDSWLMNNQSVSVENISDGDIVFLVPVDNNVRKAASMAQLNTNSLGLAGGDTIIGYTESGGLGSISVWKNSSAPAPTIDLTFNVVTIRGFGEERARAYILGVDPLAGEIAGEVSVLKEELNTLSSKIGNVVSTRVVTIDPSQWTDSSPHEARIDLFVPMGTAKNSTVLLIPKDMETKDESQRIELTVETVSSNNSEYILIAFVRQDTDPPTIPLQYLALVVYDENAPESFKATVEFVGVVNLPDELMEREVKRALEALGVTEDLITTMGDVDAVQKDVEKAKEEIDQAKTDIEKMVSVESVTVSKAMWTGAKIAQVTLSGYADPDTVFFFFPADETTKIAATKSRMTIMTFVPSMPSYGALYADLVVEDESFVKETDLTFTVLHVRENGATQRRAVLVGVDSYGDIIPTSIDLSGLDDGEVVETFSDGSTKTTTIEYDADGNPVKITDGDGNETVITW